MTGGAEIGLGSRRATDAAAEAAGRLGLGYAQLGEQQREAMARIAAGQSESANRLQLERELSAQRAAQQLREQSALEAYRQTEVEHRRQQEEQAQAAQALRESHTSFAEDLAKRHQDYLEKQATDRLSGKEYGDILSEDIAPDVKAVYRKGSPGLHIVNTKSKTGELTDSQKINLASKIPSLSKFAATLTPDDPAYGFTTNLVNRIMDLTSPPKPLAPPPTLDATADPNALTAGSLSLSPPNAAPLNPAGLSLQPPDSPLPSGPPTVTTKAEFDALPSGAIYTGKDGRKYRKP